MSHSGEGRPRWLPTSQRRATTPPPPPPPRELGLGALADELRDVLCNKPDTIDLRLGSPVSPHGLHSHPGGATTSSSGSSGPPTTRKASNNNSGELSAGSSGSSNGGGGGGGGGAGGGSPTAESVRNSGRSVRTGNILAAAPPTENPPESSCVRRSVGPAATGLLIQSGNPVRSSSPVTPAKTGRSDVLGSGMGNYGHGNVMRGGGKHSDFPAPMPVAAGNIRLAGESMLVRRAMESGDPEEVRKAGNEQYKKGHFVEALRLYDRALEISPDNAACRSNRAAALTALGRLVEAVRECEEAVHFDPNYGRAHQRLVGLYLRLGHVENARRHLYYFGHQPDPGELQKLQIIERHISRCTDARKIEDWKSALREGDAAIAAGAESCPHLFALRAEVLLKLHRLDEADSSLSSLPKFDLPLPSCSQIKFFGMVGDSYLCFVRAQVEMSLGRFENAVSAAEKSGQLDPHNNEISVLLSKVRAVARARARGNDLFNAGKFAEACSAYGEGLGYDPSNPVLYCNRAACRSKLGQWERAIDDCNNALRIQPNYTKALLRRAASNSKLERWSDAVHDYEILRKDLPDDNEVAEGLFQAQVALKKSRGEEVYNMKFGGEVEEIFDSDQFKAVVASPGVSVVHFKRRSNIQCEQISPFVDTLCVRYPSLNFLRVDIDESPAVARSENVRIVPTFKIYKNGNRVKELVCPSQQVLEYSVRHYSL
ncbi:TPR repeat-containing thioredoxin TTL1-like isoform X1 [Nymphaea colorata]|nr:TPR repeat-containing thioredoxin TTL1-like isoform X1 [Nymphaea colorata]